MIEEKQQVFYRKYRPQKLSEVVGQEHITTTLLNALSTNHTSHAYLFCGPRGTGKTSTGRILAKAVNCLTNNGLSEPCNECEMCKAITSGNALDVIEMDAASNTGVDDIRELIEKINYAPATAKYKVYIIDEVHMLSNAASNALLKTLEEPPPNIKFILATTEIHKLLPTIISRCQRFDFKRINNEAIVKQLNYICEKENAVAHEDALRAIANYSRGGLRDSENLLQQVISYYGNEVTIENVHELLGTSDGKYGSLIVKNIINKSAKDGIETIGNAQKTGINLKQLDKDVVETLRAILLIKNNCDNALDYGADEIRELIKLSNQITIKDLVKLITIFGKLENQLNDDNTLPLELAVVEACISEESESIINKEQKNISIEKVEEKAVIIENKGIKEVTANLSTTNTESVKIEIENNVSEVKPVQNTVFTPPSSKQTIATSQNQSVNNYAFEQLKLNWANIFNNAPDNLKRNQGISILKSGGVTPLSLTDNVLTLSFKYPIHKEMFEKNENIQKATELFSSYLNGKCTIKCVLQTNEDYLVKQAQKMGGQIIREEEL